jgi:hypothetical protein
MDTESTIVLAIFALMVIALLHSWGRIVVVSTDLIVFRTLLGLRIPVQWSEICGPVAAHRTHFYKFVLVTYKKGSNVKKLGVFVANTPERDELIERLQQATVAKKGTSKEQRLPNSYHD